MYWMDVDLDYNPNLKTYLDLDLDLDPNLYVYGFEFQSRVILINSEWKRVVICDS